MKKLFILLVLLSAIFLYSNVIEISQRDNIFSDISDNSQTIIEFGLKTYEIETIESNNTTFQRITCDNAGEYALEGMPDLPCFSTLIAIPANGQVSFEIVSQEQELLSDINVYPRQELQSESAIPSRSFIISEDYYSGGSTYPETSVELGEAAIMRDYRVVRLTVNPFQFNVQSNQLTINKRVSIKVNTNSRQGQNELIKQTLPSKVFEPLYAETIINYESFTRYDEYQDPSCLYIYTAQNQVFETLEYLLDWRREQGFEVTAVSTDATGSNTASIQNYIQDAYDNWANPPEYVCLVGDANGSYNIPCYWEDGGETDNNFVLLAGNDLIPDAVIGRLPFNSISEFQNILSKILTYETSPFMANTNWFERGLMVGDPSTSGSSCVDSKMYVADLMEIHSPDVEPLEYYSGNFSNIITTNLNQGCVYFNYRGFGDLSGWGQYNIDNLNNGGMLPCVVFLTCGTGSYGGNYDAFSEHFLKVGTPSNPKGAVAAISTATNSTHTTFNNAMDVGIWTGILLDETWNMGMGLTRGKLAIYLNFPNNPANHQHQFIAWNNLMGDPVMQMWSGVPQNMQAIYSEEINTGQGTFPVTLKDDYNEPLTGAKVTILDENNNSYSALTDQTGMAIMNTSGLAIGTLKLTAQMHDFIPHRDEIELSGTSDFLEANLTIIDDEGNNDGQINPGEFIEIDVEIASTYDYELTDLTINVEVAENGVVVIDHSSDIPSIPANGTGITQTPLQFGIEQFITGMEVITLHFTVSDSEQEWQLYAEVPVIAPGFYLDDYNLSITGDFEPGDDSDLVVYLLNAGTQTASNMNVELLSTDNRLSVSEESAFMGQVPPGSMGNNIGDPFHIFAEETIIPGTQITLQLNIDTPELEHPPVFFTITVGETDVNDPLGPDTYGYYCYDESDIGYMDTPEYDWIEIDPAYGGNGETLMLYDTGNGGDVETVDLPIEFSFYGEMYDEISICSNGWASPGETGARDFMNYIIPGPCGPSPMIAPYWDDIKISTGNVCYYHDITNHRFIIEWSRVRNDWDDSQQTFEIILYDCYQYPNATGDSNIKFQYNDFSNPDQGSYGGFYVYHGQFATIGIEDHTTLRGLQYTYNNEYPVQAEPITDNSALFFTTSPISQDEAYLVLYEEEILDSSNDGRIDYGDEVEYKLSIGNLGEQNATDVSAVATIEDPYITLIEDTATYSIIPSGNSVFPESGFIFEVSEDCHDEHPVYMNVVINYNGTSVERFFEFTVSAPALDNGNFYIMNDDNGNNLIDPNENMQIVFEIHNQGGAPVYSPQFEVFSLSTDLAITEIVNQLYIIPENQISYLVVNAESSNQLEPGADLGILLQINGELEFDTALNYQVNASMVMEGFESGDFEFLPWFMGGANVFNISNHAHSGVNSAQSGIIDDQQSVWLGLYFSAYTDGELSFWIDVSTEQGYDYVTFYLDDQVEWSWSGSTGWTYYTMDIDEGNHEIRWEYEKDFMVSSGSDCFWLDDISLPGSSGSLPQVLLTDTPELQYEMAEGDIINNEIEIFNISNDLADFEVRISGDDHEWITTDVDEGFIVPGQSTILTITADPDGFDSGNYQAVIGISDNFGNDLSIPASLAYSNNPAVDNEIITVSKYLGNYPNPFNPQTTFEFQLAEPQQVELDIYNIKGQRVKSFKDENLDAGTHQIIWQGTNEKGSILPSGVYFMRLKTRDFNTYSRILMLK